MCGFGSLVMGKKGAHVCFAFRSEHVCFGGGWVRLCAHIGEQLRRQAEICKLYIKVYVGMGYVIFWLRFSPKPKVDVQEDVPNFWGVSFQGTLFRLRKNDKSHSQQVGKVGNEQFRFAGAFILSCPEHIWIFLC